MLVAVRRKVRLFRDEIKLRMRGTEHVEQIFRQIHDLNAWGDPESVSGPGSSLEQTAALRQVLPAVVTKYGLRSIVDAPCGDFNWMHSIVEIFDHYVGVDIVESLIEANQSQFASETVQFLCADITRDDLPTGDVILCRDCFIHLPSRLIRDAIRTFRRSGARYLLLTNDGRDIPYEEIPIGSFRPINFRMAPFCFPEPLEVVVENSETDRQLCLWSFDQLSWGEP